MFKRIPFIFIVVCMTILFSVPAFATQDVVISGVAVEATLSENRTIEVVETYTAYIHNPVESITMTLPLTQAVQRQTSQGTEELSYPVEYSDIMLYERYVDKVIEGDTLIITTQGAGFESGAVQIPLSYTIDLGTDNTLSADEFYFRPVRGGRETSMGSFSLTFNYPKPVSQDNISITSTAGDSVIDFSLSGNTLTAYNLVSVPPEHDVLLQTSMEDGYFVGGLSTEEEEIDLFTFNNLIYGICIAVLLLALIFNITFRLKKKLVPIPVTTPPQDFSPAELYHLLRKEPSRRSALSSLIALAISGYVKISFGETGLIITKNKNIDSSVPTLQQQLFAYVFSDREQFLLDKDTLKDLTAELSVNAQRSLGQSIELEDDLTYGLSISFIVLLGVVSGVLAGLFFGVDMGITRMLAVGAGVGVPLTIGGLMVHAGYTSMRRKKPAMSYFIGLCVIIFAIVVAIIVIVNGVDYTIGLILLAAIVIMIFATASIHRRSRYANEIVAMTQSLNNFISSPDAQRLAQLVESQPDYLLTILPHAVCFNNDAQLIAAFEQAGLPIPQIDYLPPIAEMCELLPGNS